MAPRSARSAGEQIPWSSFARAVTARRGARSRVVSGSSGCSDAAHRGSGTRRLPDHPAARSQLTAQPRSGAAVRVASSVGTGCPLSWTASRTADEGGVGARRRMPILVRSRRRMSVSVAEVARGGSAARGRVGSRRPRRERDLSALGRGGGYPTLHHETGRGIGRPSSSLAGRPVKVRVALPDTRGARGWSSTTMPGWPRRLMLGRLPADETHHER